AAAGPGRAQPLRADVPRRTPRRRGHTRGAARAGRRRRAGRGRGQRVPRGRAPLRARARAQPVVRARDRDPGAGRGGARRDRAPHRLPRVPPAEARGVLRGPEAAGMSVDAADRAIIVATQAGLPLVPRPYHMIAARLGLAPEEVMRRIARMQAEGVIRRIGAVPNHYALGYRANGMSVWNVPDA